MHCELRNDFPNASQFFLESIRFEQQMAVCALETAILTYIYIYVCVCVTLSVRSKVSKSSYEITSIKV